MKARKDDSKGIDDALRASTEELVSYFRGLPNKSLSSRNEMRWGNCGSLAAVIHGRNTGKITDYEGGPGKSYSPLGFIAAELRCDMAGAFKFARDWLNLSDDRPAPTAKQVKSPEPVPAADAASRRKASRLRNILASLRDLSGTPGELYLRNRGIHIDRFPDAVRWMTPTWGGLIDGVPQRGGALVVIATNAAGKPQAAQVVHVTDDGLKAPQELVGGVVKRTAGTLAGAAVRLPGTGSVVLAEGPETGLSIWASTGREVWVCLGVSNFAKQVLPPGATVVIARDHDKPGCPADKQVAKAATTLTEAGHAVRIARPPIVGDDFNDVLRRDGAEAVRALIDAAVLFEPTPETVEPSWPMPTRTIIEIAATVEAEIFAFFDQVARNPGKKLCIGIIGDCAAGKTRAVIAASRRIAAAERTAAAAAAWVH
ncbi:toprim domain-containing protein [Magnetospirillum fulvum]|uniref:p-loop ATPase-like protein n=1 Tax=Magnetospirillum fulvum MGU-K5 TaxID=1316936 RepID=S9SGK8_MAGFU|nr:toprim domain-containing protein [Magnetospirillum fulvum]EPY03228.1 P-loop ATPase-like protein [Magnetospirillum fulvum MGU-K5]